MIAAKVIASIEVAKRLNCLTGIQFVLAEILGGTDAGRLVIAADMGQVHVGERVIIRQENSDWQAFAHDKMPIDAVIIKCDSTTRYRL